MVRSNAKWKAASHQKNSLGVLLGCKSARNVSAVFVLVEQVLRVENGDQIQEFEAGSI